MKRVVLIPTPTPDGRIVLRAELESLWERIRRAFLAALLSALALAAPAQAASGPRYDVPRGYTRCPDAKAWHGFFKWASAEHATCRETARVMRAFADRSGATLPARVGGYRCRAFYWRDSEGDVYASRHTCTRGDAVVRFYGMV